jgi:hypothetical protein
MIICHGKVIFCPYLFGVLEASGTWIVNARELQVWSLNGFTELLCIPFIVLESFVVFLFVNFLLRYIHCMGLGFVATIMIRLTFYIIYIALMPLNHLPIPLRQLQEVF